ncbi:hypothetical protein N476_08740 [Pseudoalteromonas luteoviolacea H33]|uniref:SPOR domain-containing protein n=1 Tax=Pseudoalteromonas luteoviolacea H33 TaxID=1365251 RepID=A0A162ANJ8_9GAMM|nr:hypothetical protein N476_08740 [Pseudoalteromonas luteoviolacea H33]KZN76730.1 hypothetical protein N477_14900 [Pseudoalteromonas luteoviolacea H33-S]
MPLKFVVLTCASIFIMLHLTGCSRLELSLDEKVAQQEAIYAQKAMLASYEKNKASIERLANLEEDLTQLLDLLSAQTEVRDVHSSLQPAQTVVKHSNDFNKKTNASSAIAADAVMHSSVINELSMEIPDVVLGIHLRQENATSQIQVIRDRIDIIRQSYPLVFNRITASISEPDPNRNLFYVTANGFTSLEEAKVFCKVMFSVTRRCSELKN